MQRQRGRKGLELTPCQAVQQMIEMWESEVADPGSDNDKLKLRLANVLKAFLDYMKKGNNRKEPTKQK